jgi:hypothetical protein
LDGLVSGNPAVDWTKVAVNSGFKFGTIFQGCQIFLGTIYHSGEKYTEQIQNYQMPIKYTQW